MSGEELRAKRAAAGIPGRAGCEATCISRPRLSDIERGYVDAPADELRRIYTAIEEIVATRQRLTQLAADEGLSLAGVRI